MTKIDLRRIWEKTKGHCHFCGDPVEIDRRGWREGDLSGYWEVDHMIQRDKGGSVLPDNCLPACTRCNRLRWQRKGEQLRELLFLGLIARDEIRSQSAVGRVLARLRQARLSKNQSRRKSRNGNGRAPAPVDAD
jgi:5-methylcytosine-specific restriction endonuclease McrA